MANRKRHLFDEDDDQELQDAGAAGGGWAEHHMVVLPVKIPRAWRTQLDDLKDRIDQRWSWKPINRSMVAREALRLGILQLEKRKPRK